MKEKYRAKRAKESESETHSRLHSRWRYHKNLLFSPKKKIKVKKISS